MRSFLGTNLVYILGMAKSLSVLFRRFPDPKTLWNMLSSPVLYQIRAVKHGVRYLGFNKKHRIILFQDPITGSSFAVKAGERVETGIQRVRERFGLVFT